MKYLADVDLISREAHHRQSVVSRKQILILTWLENGSTLETKITMYFTEGKSPKHKDLMIKKAASSNE
jgi:hypothetical protein